MINDISFSIFIVTFIDALYIMKANHYLHVCKMHYYYSCRYKELYIYK